MSSPRQHRHILPVTVVLALVLAVILAACGGSEDGDSPSAAAGSAPADVSVEPIDGVGDVLVDADGAALYTADQEMDGTVRCTRSCADTWIPLTLPGGGEPTASDEVAGELGVVERPGGARQVTFEGQPLYSFADDGGPGVVSGDGLADTFDGELFSWQVARADGGASGGAEPQLGPY
jgi:predicted lipoprotein with Yx(FWY)xxD motif